MGELFCKNCKQKTNFIKEYMGGMHTGDHVCTSCGESILTSEYHRLTKKDNSKD